MVEEAPWRKRSRSEDRRPGQLSLNKKEEPAWKQGLQLLKKPQVKAEESLKLAPAWKSGAEMLRKSSPNRRTSLIDTVPPLASKTSSSADVPWKSGVQLLKKTSRENSPTKTDLPETSQEASVPWKIGVQMLRKTSRDSSPATTPSHPEAPVQLGVPWKSVKLRKTSGSRDVSPEKRESTTSTQLLEVVEWKAGKEMLRKRSPTPVRPESVESTEQVHNKKDSAKAFLTQKLAALANKEQEAKGTTIHQSRDKLKTIPIKKAVKEEHIHHVELKPTPQKPKPNEKEPPSSPIVLRKIPGQSKEISDSSETVLKAGKKPDQIETFGRVDLKKTPQKQIKEIAKPDHKVELKPIPPKSKPEELQHSESKPVKKVSQKTIKIPSDSSKTTLMSVPTTSERSEISTTDVSVVKQKIKPELPSKPKESVQEPEGTSVPVSVKPAIPQKPKTVSLERKKLHDKTTENIDASSSTLVSDDTEEVISATQLKETLLVELENKNKPELPAKPASFNEEITLKHVLKLKEAHIAEPQSEIQLKRTLQKPCVSKSETAKVELKKVTTKDLKPAPMMRKDEAQEQWSDVKLKPVPAKLVSKEVSEQLLSSSEPLKPQLEQFVEKETTAEVGKPLEPTLVIDNEPEIVTVTPWRKNTLILEPPVPANVEDSAESAPFQSESITIETNLSSQKGKEKSIKQIQLVPEQIPEVVLKRTPQRNQPEETAQEGIQLKKIPLKSPIDDQDQTVSLKPIPRPKEDEKTTEVVLKRTPQKSKPEEVETQEIKLKRVSVKPKEMPDKPEIKLKPITPRKEVSPIQPKQVDVGSIQHIDDIPQQTKESITLAKRSPDRTGQMQPPIVKDVTPLATPTRVDQVILPDSVPEEVTVAKREVPWRKKAVPQVPENKEKIDIVPVTLSQTDETPKTSIPTSTPADVFPKKTKDVPVDVKITLEQVIPARIEPESVPEVAPELQTLQTSPPEETKLTGIVLSKPQEIPKIPEGSKSVKRSPREPDVVPIPQQVVLKRTPQKPKVEEPEPEIVKLKKIPQPEAPSVIPIPTPESQSNIPTSIPEKVPQVRKDVPVVTQMILKPTVPAREIEPEGVTEVLLKPSPQVRKPEEIQPKENVISKPKETPTIPEGSKSVKRSPREPEVVPVPQQVVLKRTPQKPKVEEPQPEIIKLKKIPQPESVTQTQESKIEVQFDKVPAVFKSESEIPTTLSSDHVSQVSIEFIPEDKKPQPELPVTAEAKIDVSPSWRKPRTPSVTPTTPMEEKPLKPEVVETVPATPIPEQSPPVDQISSSVTRLKRTQRQYIPDISQTTSVHIQQVELKPVDEPATATTLTASVKSVQLKRPDVPAVPSVTSEIKTEQQAVTSNVVSDQTVSITTKKISKTFIHKTEMVQQSPEEKVTRLPKMKASISMAPKFQAPVFTKKLQPLSSRTGKKVRLHCQFQGEPQPTITWYRNESVLLPTADRLDITTEPTSSVLEISQIVLDDTGIYTCRAVNEAGSAITSANFIVQAKGEGGEAPRFVLPLSPIRASDGEPTKLICTLTGKPIPQITWYCGQREIRPSRDFQPAFEPTTGAASLTIAEVFPDDEGIYRCRATNTHGTAECEAALTVGDMIVVSHQELIRAPVIAQPLEPDRVETGCRKVMTIRFDGYPTPEVKWYHNGREIQQTENRLVTTFKNESTLVIVRCDADSTGKYEARAMNEGGEARTSASIQLRDVKTTAQQPPKFRKALRPQIVPESEAIIMEVEVESAPECVFNWKQHGTAIQSTEAMQIVTQNNKSTLFIPESFVENSGIYTVKAENPAGSVASTATLTVERQLLAEEFTPPFIVKELPQTKVMDGEEVRLICQVSGTPMPRIKWYHNGQPVREHNGVMMSLSPQGEAVLRLAEAFPEDAGVYECKAVNRAGQITTSTTLHVERYEYIPDSESASITAGPSVGTWEDLTGPSGSEDDLLSDKPVVKKSVKTKTEKKSKFQPQESKEEELVQDSGAAPRFVVALPQQIDIKDGQQARFEVKVESYPRSSVFWYLNGKEIQSSKDFGIDHLEDGTSILTLSEVFPDDAGELMCEAHNDKGVVTSIAHLNVTEYKDTPTYRKPEWVTKMEIVRAQMLGNSSLPVPRIRLNNIGSDSERSMSIDSATMHELISKCHSMGDVSTGSDSVFISDCGSSRRPSLNNLKSSEYDTLIPHVPMYKSDLSVASASIFAQSVLSGYLNSHRQSITAAIQAIGGPTDDDNKTPTPSSDEEDESDTSTYPDESNCDDDDDVEPVRTRVEDDMPRLEVPRTLNFSTMLSPIQENGETPTSETAQALDPSKPQSLKTSMTDLISASSMEDLKEFLMLETMYDIS